MTGRWSRRRKNCSELVNIFSHFASRTDRESDVVGERGKGRSFVEQDKATAVRYGIFDAFSTSSGLFPVGDGHDPPTVRYGRKTGPDRSLTPSFSVSRRP